MLHKHEPVDEKAMKWTSPKFTICETLRQIYWRTNDPDIKLFCRIATSMAKSMNNKLQTYKKDWDDNFFDENPAFKEAINGKGPTRIKI